MSSIDSALARCAVVAEGALGADARRAGDAALYLAHVEAAAPIRRLAEAAGKPVSSVHRAVRRMEAMRDDPLFDAALDAMGEAARAHLSERSISDDGDAQVTAAVPDPSSRAAEAARRVLQRLAEPDSFLLVAQGADRAGVFSRKNRFRRPLSLISVAAAVDFAARDWVRCVSRTAASAKYAITPVGRAYLRRAGVEAEDPADDAPSPFAAQHRAPGVRLVAREDGSIAPIKVNLGESPLGWLARRKGADGAPFLTPEEVEAGERLREDYEAAQMGPRVAQDWDNFLAPLGRSARPSAPAEGPAAARERLARAVADLGPGLADAALRACCFLEGLEATERRMGWSARSGKVVLKIALQRLALHYGLATPPSSAESTLCCVAQ